MTYYIAIALPYMCSYYDLIVITNFHVIVFVGSKHPQNVLTVEYYPKYGSLIKCKKLKTFVTVVSLILQIVAIILWLLVILSIS